MWTTCPICGKGIVITWPQLYVYRRGEDYLCSENCTIVYETQRTRAANGFGNKKKEGERKDVALTQKQREKAVEIAVQGGDQIEYLKKECGAPNPWATWAYLKKKLEKENPVKYNRLLQVETLKHVGIDPKSKLPVNFQDIREVVADEFPPNDGSARISMEEAEELAKEELESDICRKKPEVKVVAEVPELTRMTETPEQPLNLQGGVNYQIKVEESRKARKPFRVIGLETDYGRFTVGTINGVLRFQAEGEIEICMVTEDWLKMAETLPEILRALGVEA